MELIETITTADNYFITNEQLNTLRANVATWLHNNGFGSVQEIIDSGYDHLLHFIKCAVDLNFNVRSSISIDYHFARLVEDFYNDENRQKYGDNFKAEFFGETFMKVLAEVV